MESFCKVDLVEGSVRGLFILACCEEGSITVKVSDGDHTWQGNLSQEQLQGMADSCKMSFHSYLDETWKAFSRKSLGDLLLAYFIKPLEGGGIQFVWKKKIADGILFQLGAIDLCPAPKQMTHCSLLEHCIGQMDALSKKVQELEDNCAQLNADKRAALEQLQHQYSTQGDLEDTLYGRFKLVLNEKKSKIRKLMELKAHLTEQNEELQHQVWETKSKGPSPTTVDEETVDKDERVKKLSTTVSPLESLLSDTVHRPSSSPPPTKRHRPNKPTKTRTEIPHPPNITVRAKTENDANTTAKISVDSNDLLEML